MSKAVDDWVRHGVSGKLLGTMPYIALKGTPAEVEIYWINDPDFIGLRYPDNGRLAPGAGWMHYRDPIMQRKFSEIRTEWLKIHDLERYKAERKAEAKKNGVMLRLKNSPKKKVKLQFKKKVKLKFKPKLTLRRR